MRCFSLPNVSVTSSGDEYFQVSFDDGDDEDSAYFLIQRQFESRDGGVVYLESQEEKFCGHFRIARAELGRVLLIVEILGRPAETVQIKFEADERQFEELQNVLKMIIPSCVLKLA